MMFTRRRLMVGALGMAGCAGAGRSVVAATSLEAGERRIDVLSDGHLALPGAFVFAPTSEGTAEEMEAAFGIDAERLEPPCHCTLLRDRGRTVLFDAGSGTEFMPSAGLLPEALAAIGVAPEEVTDLVLTHAHPDHLWGVLDDFGDPAFPEARVIIGGAERTYWSDPATVGTIGEARQAMAVGAARRLSEIEGATQEIADGDEAAPGVTARLTPGHTPGHMSFEVEMDGARLLVAGDAIGNHHLAFRRPWLPSGADHDMETAADTRIALLSDLAERGAPLIGFHLPGGLGRVERRDGAFAFLPAA